MNEVVAVKTLRKEILKDFFIFLKKKHAYVQFRRNIADAVIREEHSYKSKEERKKIWYDAFHYGIHIRILHNGFVKLTYPICLELINYAFFWDGTPERHKFWYTLNTEWQDIVMKKYKTYRADLNK